MSAPFYERLSAQDASFLVFESPATHMHLGGTVIFDRGPLATRGGGVDIERIREHVASRLHWIPRYRQKLHFTPVENHPIWVDDDRLNLAYHVRHTSLPRPGGDQQLKSLAARVMSQQLDRGKPLWELWIVEGLERDRFAMILKTHHCVVDGLSGVDLMSVLLSPDANPNVEPSPEWRPRRAPTTGELLRAELRRRTTDSLAIGGALRSVWNQPARLGHNLSAAFELVRAGLKPPANTPLNQPIGPYRRFEWAAFSLAEVKGIKNAWGGSINDVVLATVAGAVRRFFSHRGFKLGRVEYKATIPVSVRTSNDQGAMGNHVSAWLLSLPVREEDPRRCFDAVRTMTTRMKESKQAEAIEIFTQIAEFAAPILNLGVAFASRMSPYNLIVTNVPGPPVPLYLLGARMHQGFPSVPLFENQGLALALFSYDGWLCWGINADWDLVPDIERFGTALQESFHDLRTAARVKRSTRSRTTNRKR